MNHSIKISLLSLIILVSCQGSPADPEVAISAEAAQVNQEPAVPVEVNEKGEEKEGEEKAEGKEAPGLELIGGVNKFMYLQDGKNVYVDSAVVPGSPKAIPEADIASFRVKSVPMQGIDDTFEYAYDKNYIYLDGKPFESSHSESFEILEDSFFRGEDFGLDGGIYGYALDKYSVYTLFCYEGCESIKRVEGSDPATFEIMNGVEWRDENRFYYREGGGRVEDASQNKNIVSYLEEHTTWDASDPGTDYGKWFCSYTPMNDDLSQSILYIIAHCNYYYQKEAFLHEGAGYAGLPIKLTIHEDGSMTHWKQDFYDKEELIKQFGKQYSRWQSKEYDHRKEKIRYNAYQAEEYYKIPVLKEEGDWLWED